MKLSLPAFDFAAFRTLLGRFAVNETASMCVCSMQRTWNALGKPGFLRVAFWLGKFRLHSSPRIEVGRIYVCLVR
eukprot:5168168-Pleurochrysis_carterae.AAC.1